MIRVNQIKVNIAYTDSDLKKKLVKILRTTDFTVVRLAKKSVDARDKNNLQYILSVDVEVKNEQKILSANKKNNNIVSYVPITYEFPYKIKDGQKAKRPIIIGAGPAGYFCGLYLARNGYKPIIIERGKDVFSRTKDVDEFWSGGVINKNSNVSFGEGGAGTFSDGKLNTGIKDKEGRIEAFLADFISFGASPDISYMAKPHVGTGVLKTVMSNMRKEIISYGGEIYFNTVFIGYEKNNGDLTIKCRDLLSDRDIIFDTNALILAIGHSARDTFRMLHDKKLPIKAKPFAIGLRVEHKREDINKSQYGDSEAARLLPAADYKLTYRSKSGRSVYSFCMCPGGYVVNASSDDKQAVVNGMSYSDRNAANSNSAIVVGVTPEDFTNEGFGEYGELSGVYFQEKYERLAYEAGNGKIPIQKFSDFKAGVVTKELGKIKPCIKGEYEPSNLHKCLPEYVNNAIIEGISYFDNKIKGFANADTILSGIESRTSSPLRLIRDENFMSEVKGIFPCGEGAGYAGGITSAAVDGIKVAEAVAAYINKLEGNKDGLQRKTKRQK